MANKIPRSYAPGDNKDYDKKKPGNEESESQYPLVVAQPQKKHVAYVFYYYHSGSGRRSEWMTLCKDTMQCNFRSRTRGGALRWSGLHGKWSWDDGTLRIWDWNCRGEHAPKACRKDTGFVLAADNEFLCDQISPCGHAVRRRMWYIGEFHIEVLEALAAEAELEDVTALSIASWQPSSLSIASGVLALEDGTEVEDGEWILF
ncbi:unnamed protein product [Cladocopium goreaui]|uniref:Uncharacterized protein n=1 Tax=Cladocopium goreaui TaxID=2562237 RepID=A0A9P1CEV9_9DINO|nr:unnamed protein product [Cladocopium goreaui]CAI3977897.1 unnamed protein product [Cladocopium goreaui]CAI3990524.1 unnamed protein product [Cladocopium goreaui]CAI4007342.1 unnamed protein product [Cladocopium goreaui]